MNDLYKENGLLSEHGQLVTHPVKMAVKNLLRQEEEIVLMNESQLRILGGILQKIVADEISERIQLKKEIAKKLADIQDEQFYALLKEKYGERWILASLTEEELARLPKLSDQDRKDILEKARAHKEAAEKAMPAPYIDPSIRFRQ